MLSFLNNVFMVLSFVIAIVVHEYSHGWMARKLGDYTAHDAGRLTFNPIAHIDPIGTVILPLLLLIAGSPPFGWAKPVPVNPYHLNDPKKDMAKVSLAGPAANFLVATTAALFLRLAGILPINLINVIYSPWASVINPFIAFLGYLILINLLLGVFNLIPIPPLDGSKILQAFLPRDLLWQYKKLEPYGFMIVIIFFLFLGGFDKLILPILELIIRIYSIH